MSASLSEDLRVPAPEALSHRRDVQARPSQAPGRRGAARALLISCRPRQWAKNALVVAAPAAAGMLGRPAVLERTALAFVSFCLLASATYLANDVRDRAQDRLHPRKRHRPLAAGEIAPALAIAAAGVLALLGLAVALAAGISLLALAAGYLLLTCAYVLWWRNVAVMDILAIAAGFFVRASAGGAAAHIHISSWFVLEVSLGAVLVVGGKRHAELLAGARSRDSLRPVLRRYSLAFLRRTYLLSALGAIAVYCLWAARHSEPRIPFFALTIVPFAAGLARYVMLLERGGGQAPEELLLEDRLLLVACAAWLAAFSIGVYAAH